MATCDLATLLRDGKCFCGATTNKKDIAELQLLCNILSAIGGGGGTVQDMQVAWTPTNVKLGEVLGFFTFGDSGLPANIVFNQATNSTGFDIEASSTVQTLSFPNLATIDPLNTQSGTIFITHCNALTSVSLPLLQTVPPGAGMVINFCPSLTSINLSSFVPNNGDILNYSSNALDAASVNLVLRRCVLNAAYVSGNVVLDVGTNAPPSGQGIADKATLIGRGVTVNTN